MATEVVKVWHYKVGYEVRYERISGDEAGGGPPFVMRSAHTPEGHYIGDPKTARYLIVKRGIKPEPRIPPNPSANGGRGRTCSIGFCEREQRWFGWSHRAIFGFGIGHVVEEGNCEAGLDLPVGFEAKTLEDAKRMATAFAESVS